MVERVPLPGAVQGTQPRQTHGACVRRRGHSLSGRPSITRQHANGREVQDGGGVPAFQRCGAACAVLNPLKQLDLSITRGEHHRLQGVCVSTSPALGLFEAPWPPPPFWGRFLSQWCFYPLWVEPHKGT